MLINEKDLKYSIQKEINNFLLNEEVDEAESTEEEKEEESEDTTVEDNAVDNSLRGVVVKFLGQLEGIHIVLKELHWAADRNAEHVLLDEIDGGVLGLLDEVAEVTMGLLDEQFGRGDLKVEECDCSDCKAILARIEEVVLDAKKGIGDEPKHAGLQSVLDDFLANVNKWNYLRRL